MLSQIDLKTLPFALLGFAARSGTGKTTLLQGLIPLLKSRGFRLGLIKHTHHKIIFDNRGLTRKVFAQGVDVMARSTAISMAEWQQKNPKTALIDGINTYRHLPIDLLLVEGFKQVGFPKIELHRQTLNAPLLCHSDPHVVALATDNVGEISQKTNLPILDLNDISSIADWIENFIDNSNWRNL